MKLELTILCLFNINREMIEVREINIKNRTYYFFDDMSMSKNLDLSHIKIYIKIFLLTTLVI